MKKRWNVAAAKLIKSKQKKNMAQHLLIIFTTNITEMRMKFVSFMPLLRNRFISALEYHISKCVLNEFLVMNQLTYKRIKYIYCTVYAYTDNTAIMQTFEMALLWMVVK